MGWLRSKVRMLEYANERRRCLAAGIPKGSGTPNKQKVGKVTRAQVQEIAKTKLPDLNCDTLEAAVRIVEGSARSMGVEIVG